jgi:hypothetical protein
MPRTTKTTDPARVALLDRIAKARAAFERAYARLKRAFNAMEKHKRQAVRLSRQLDKLDTEP